MGIVVNDEENKNKIHGWFVLFLLQIGVGAVISVVLMLSGFDTNNYETGLHPFLTYIGITCDLLAMVGLVFGACYTIYSIIKRKANAVSLAMIYVCVIMLSNLVLLLIGQYESGLVGSLRQIVTTLAWNITWLLYLYFSEQVADIFPKEMRVIRKADFILFLIVVLPVLWLSLILLMINRY